MEFYKCTGKVLEFRFYDYQGTYLGIEFGGDSTSRHSWDLLSLYNLLLGKFKLGPTNIYKDFGYAIRGRP